nr:Gp49 family protein [Stenotrophomonas sp. MMGLT7]
MDNHARVVGVNHGSISSANHSAELGRKYAREDAVRQAWELLGFRLRDWLHAQPGTF